MNLGYKKEVSCPDCGNKRFIRKDSLAQRCQSCSGRKAGAMAERKKTGIHRSCLVCRKEFWVYKYLAGKRYFCSVDCANNHKTIYQRMEKNCAKCGAVFVTNDRPFSNSAGKYCSLSCRNDGYRTGINVTYKPTKQAIMAGAAVRAALKRGELVRPLNCEECHEQHSRIEAAHFNYEEKLRVRWLCIRCHRKWDNAEPKGGTQKVLIGKKC